MKKKILLIDDSPFFLEVLSDLLTENFSIEKATSAEAAIELLEACDQEENDRSRAFDLVITDFEMHGKTGFDVAERVKGKKRTNKFMPVIMLTGKNITKEEARQHGCATCIPKTDFQKVVSMVKILFPD